MKEERINRDCILLSLPIKEFTSKMHKPFYKTKTKGAAYGVVSKFILSEKSIHLILF